MINYLKIIFSLLLVVALLFFNLQLSSGSLESSILNSNYNLEIEKVDASTCKQELGGICERYSEWDEGQCNVRKSDLAAYPCKE